MLSKARLIFIGCITPFALIAACKSSKSTVSSHEQSSSSHSTEHTVHSINNRSFDTLIKVPQRYTSTNIDYLLLLNALKSGSKDTIFYKSKGQGISAALKINSADSSVQLEAQADSTYILLKALSERIEYIERNKAKDISNKEVLSYKEVAIRNKNFFSRNIMLVAIITVLLLFPDIIFKSLNFITHKIKSQWQKVKK